MLSNKSGNLTTRGDAAVDVVGERASQTTSCGTELKLESRASHRFCLYRLLLFSLYLASERIGCQSEKLLYYSVADPACGLVVFPR